MKPSHRPPRLDLVTGAEVSGAEEIVRLRLTPAEREVLDAWLRTLAIDGERRQLARTLRRVVIELARGRARLVTPDESG